jgi:hypothetical protein
MVLADPAAEDQLPLDRAEVNKIVNRSRDRGFDIRRSLASRLTSRTENHPLP